MLNSRTPRSLNVKLGPRRKGTGGLVSIVSYSRPSLMIIASRTQFPVEMLRMQLFEALLSTVHLGADGEPGDGGQLEVDLCQQQREEGAGLLRALRHRHRHVAAE